jgi:hypothetical protein
MHHFAPRAFSRRQLTPFVGVVLPHRLQDCSGFISGIWSGRGSLVTEYTFVWPWRVRVGNPGGCLGRHSAWHGPSSPRTLISAAVRLASRNHALAGARVVRRPTVARSIPHMDCLANCESLLRIARYRWCKVRPMQPMRSQRRERVPRRQQPLSSRDWTYAAPRYSRGL